MLKEVVLDSALDVAKMLPGAFAVILLSDVIMARLRSVKISGSAAGVVTGSLLGIIPQCGIPVGFAKLYADGAIGLAVIISVFLSSSDEAVIIAVGNYDFPFVLKFLAVKIAVALTIGGACSFFAPARLGREMGDSRPFMPKTAPRRVKDLIAKAARGTVVIAAYVFVIELALGLLIESVGESAITALLSSSGLFIQPVVAALIGAIPNCASSIFLMKAYGKGILSFSALISGLCANSGYGILVIFRSLPLSRSLKFTALLISLSVASGELLTLPALLMAD
ncbi:MAG: hypothetical protein LBL73_12300 [Synergistaceae bacterium]|jgi:hypothetical protein|nr:hypothetical protein [Synergistaceae bacterium]